MKAAVPGVERSAILTACLLANLLGLLTSTRLFTYRRQQFLAVRDAQRAQAELAVLAMTDPLTSVYNRRRFIELGTEQLVLFRRYQQPFCVHMLDLDFFKQINDTYGHHAGDTVLQHVTQLVTHHKREPDIFGRLGGEEFGLILPNTAQAAAVRVGERLRQELAATPLMLADNEVVITVSVGIAEVSPTDQDFTTLMNRADQLLYQAKRNGRNRVEAERDSEDGC